MSAPQFKHSAISLAVFLLAATAAHAQTSTAPADAAVQTLPTRQREVVVCRYYLELTEAETAAMLDIGLGSVKRHAHRGLARLQDRLGESR